jgi:hypothetical protein
VAGAVVTTARIAKSANEFHNLKDAKFNIDAFFFAKFQNIVEMQNHAIDFCGELFIVQGFANERLLSF